MLREMMLLTSKPIVFVCNVDEDSILTGNEHTRRLEAALAGENPEIIYASALGIEAEIAELESKEERDAILNRTRTQRGRGKPAICSYHLLDLITYFIAGEKEVRAWTITRGTKAPGAAGVIHSDFEKGFIRAEVIKYKDFLQYGSEAAVKEAGKMAVEGKEYVVEDGDIMHFRFNV